jgi:hypothetical protein
LHRFERQGDRKNGIEKETERQIEAGKEEEKRNIE